MASTEGCASTSLRQPTLAHSISIASPLLVLASIRTRSVSRKSRNAAVVSLRLLLWRSSQAAAAREETADLLAEHMDGLVRQPFLQIDEIGEKRGAPAIGAKILGEPSRRGVALAHNLLPAVGMNRLTARRVHRQAAQKIKAIEKAVEIGGARRIR